MGHNMRKGSKKLSKDYVLFIFFVSLFSIKCLPMQKSNVSTNYRQELRERILKASMHEFMTKGIKAVKMDDLATELSISKRTLYEIYSNKEELLLAGMKLHEQEYDHHMAQYAAVPGRTVMDIILEFYRMQIRHMVGMNSLVFLEIQKYRSVFEFLNQKHLEREEKANAFFRRGVQEGFFRGDVDYGIVAGIGNASIHHVMESRMYEQYEMEYIFQNIIFLFIRGICTQKGIRIVDSFLEESSKVGQPV